MRAYRHEKLAERMKPLRAINQKKWHIATSVAFGGRLGPLKEYYILVKAGLSPVFLVARTNTDRISPDLGRDISTAKRITLSSGSPGDGHNSLLQDARLLSGNTKDIYHMGQFQ